MKIKYFISLIILGTFIFSSCTVISDLSQQQIAKGPEFTPYEGLKTSIAVLDFENYAEQGGKKLGSGVADMLVGLLVKSGRFIVIERQRIQEILEEQALGQSGAVTEETAPQVGQLLGVQSLVLGDILELEQKTGSHRFSDDDDEKDDEEKKNPWELALKATVGHVKLHYRIVDTTTGEIIISDHISATQIRPGFGIKTKEFDFEDMFEFDQTIIGIATRKAVNKIAMDIARAANKLKWQGKVVRVKKEDNIIYFTPGRNSGVRMGDQFEIWGESTEFSEDGEELTEIVEKGTVEVIGFVGDKVAKAAIVEGDDISQGDRISIVE